jgi:sodium transport system permease protein
LSTAAKFWLTFKEVFKKEFRHCLRDKDVFIYTFIVPALIYPLLMLCFSEVLMFQQEADKTQKVKFAVAGPLDGGLKAIVTALERSNKYELAALNPPKSAGRASVDDALALGNVAAVISRGMKNGKPVVNLKISRGFKTLALPGEINECLRAGYYQALKSDFQERGIAPSNLQVLNITMVNIDPQLRNTLSPILALLAFSLCTMTLGAAYPSIACAAEEFERKTIETSSLLPVPRNAMMLGKLASVTTFGASAGLLNALSTFFVAASISVQLKKLLPVAFEENAIKLDFFQVLAMLGCYLLLSVSVASCLILVSSLCHTVRSAQHWISFPLTIIMVMPALLIMPSVELNWQLALVPALNLSLLIKSIFNGVKLDGSAELAIFVSLVLIVLSLKMARSFLFEGTDPGQLLARLWHAVGGRKQDSTMQESARVKP